MIVEWKDICAFERYVNTFRERHPLSRFLIIASDIVNEWSTSRNQDPTDPIVFSTEPTIGLKKWTDSYNFQNPQN